MTRLLGLPLIELCGIFRTLLADHDGLYDPTAYNDRLLLGLRGMMSEAELHMLRGRMYEALLNKARRGDLYMLAPIGYVKLPQGEFAIDPDEQVQAIVRLVFDTFDRQGTLRGVLRYLVRHGITLPIRPHTGPNRGNLEWSRPTRDAVATILTHPLYAGTYRYGFRQIDPRRKNPEKRGSGRVVMRPGGLSRPDSRSLSGLHHGGTFRTEPATIGGEPSSRRVDRGSARGLVVAGRLDLLRSLRSPHGRSL